MNKSNSLYYFLLELNLKLNKDSELIYSKLQPLLQEDSHSFGFKLFSQLSEEIINGINDIHQNKDLEYLYYESYQSISVNDLFLKTKQNKNLTKKYLELIIKISKILYSKDLELGKIFSLFLTDLQSDPAKHSFLYTDNIIKYIEYNLDLKIFKDFNKIEKEEDSYLGIFYWFFAENNFGEKKLKIHNLKIESTEIFLNYLKENKVF
jgi:hypothetical protein